MELHVLKNFLEIAREENMTAAAARLHISQPALSRQMADLEKELGKKLFVRTNRKTLLTEDGMLLRKRATEIVALVQKTEEEFASSQDAISGTITIGAAETSVMSWISDTFAKMHKEYPDIKFEVYSCTADDAKEKLEKGLLDFALMFEPADKSKFDYIEIEQYNVMGLLLPEESPLAQKETIQKEDVLDIPLLVSARMQNDSRYPFAKWLKEDYEKLDITATYNLIYNAARMVESGLGYAVCIDHVADSGLKKPLCFRPFYPKVPMHLVLVWKKYQLRSAAQKLFLETFQDLCNAERKRQD